MRVLVAYGSRHGATGEIAEAIGAALREEGLDADVASFEDEPDPGGYEAFVLGSAVYMGRWLESARLFAEANGPQLAHAATWIFSSGPVGDPPRPAEAEAVQVDEIATAAGPREHRLFGGRLERRRLGLGERAMAAAFGVKDGDFRSWAEIDSWARAIAAALTRTDAR
jgi:menaquinone-dependent protoporphyrinogen oxidase